MRVAVFTDNDFDKINGVTTTLKAMLQFSGDAVSPCVYTAADVERDVPGYFAACSRGIGLPWYSEMRVYWPRRAFARRLERDHVQVVHITTPGPMGLAARWLARQLHLPVTGSYHTHLGEYAERLSGSMRLGHWTERYVRWVYGPCDPLLVPSAATMRMLVARGYHSTPFRIWARGVDTARFSRAHRSAQLRDAWRVSDRRPAVIYAGRVSREKGLAMLPAIQQIVREHRAAYQLVIAGHGPMEQELRAACPDAVFLGAISHAEMATAMASSDVMLFPSGTDSLGNVVLEAQAAGLPVIVSDRGGPQEQVLAGQTGFVCRDGDAAQFASRLIELLRDPAAIRRMGDAARAHALTRDWPSSLAPLFRAWHDAARQKAPAPGDILWNANH